MNPLHIRFRGNFHYFKPRAVPLVELSEVTLTVDEFEAMRLKDKLGLDQIDAAKKMDVSQPTFHRILESARKKIAEALINGKAIKIEGGNFKMTPGFGRGQGRGMGQGRAGGPTVCVCPSCGHEGFKEDMQHNEDDEECQEYLKDIGVLEEQESE